MQKKQWLGMVVGLVLVQALTLNTGAQDSFPKGGKGTNGFQTRMEHAVGLTPEQKEAVRGLLAQQSQDLRGLRDSIEPKMASVQSDTDAKIRALLNPEQLKKFDAFLVKQKQSRASRSRRTS
jgi:hypothetical protein